MFRDQPMTRVALQVVIASVVVSALLGIYALLAGDFGDVQGRILASTLSVLGASVLGLACAAAWERGRLSYLPPAGMAASVLGFAILIFFIWATPEPGAVWRTAVSLILASIAAAHASLLSFVRLPERHKWVFYAAVGTAFALAALLIAMIWWSPEGDAWPRLIGVLAILMAAATITSPVMGRMYRDEVAEDGDDEEAGPMRVRHCPRCGAAVQGQAGDGIECGRCGARFVVEMSAG